MNESTRGRPVLHARIKTHDTPLSRGRHPGEYAHDLAVYIGRLEPPTIAHIKCIRRALSAGRYAVLFLGSAFQARSPRNFLFFGERMALVRACLDAEENARLDIVPVADTYDNDLWKTGLRRAVREVRMARGLDGRASICLVGHSKDASSYYLNMFPGWTSIEVGNIDSISATPIREDYLSQGQGADALVRHAGVLPAPVVEFLGRFKDTPDYAWLMAEMAWSQGGGQGAGVAARGYHAPIVTTEAVVIQSAHVLMTRRLEHPGLGLLSLPGGRLQDESFLDGILRVLVRDHGLMVTPTRKPDMARSLLEGKLEAEDIFDHPNRSERGHVISRAHLFRLRDDRHGLPMLGQGSQSCQPLWMPIEDLDPQMVFEDHYTIIERMRSLSRKSG